MKKWKVFLILLFVLVAGYFVFVSSNSKIDEYNYRSSPDMLDVCLANAMDVYGGYEAVQENPAVFLKSNERITCYKEWFGEDYQDHI